MAQLGRATGDHDLPWHDESADTAARGETQIETAPPAPPIYDVNDPTLRLGGRQRRSVRRASASDNASRADALVASIDRLRLPPTAVGYDAEPRAVTITNLGPVPVEIGDVRASDAHTEKVFRVYATALEMIEPGASIELRIGFQPDRLGAHAGTYQILDGNGATASTIKVSGRGIKLADAMQRAVAHGDSVTVTTYAEVLAAVTAATRLAESSDPQDRQRATALAEAVVVRFDEIAPSIYAAAQSYGVAGTSLIGTWGHARSEVTTFWRALRLGARTLPGDYIVRVVEVAQEVIKVGTKEARRARTFDRMNVTQGVVDFAQYVAGFCLGALKGAAGAIRDLVRTEERPAGEGAFGICSFWVAEFLAMGGGSLAEARIVLEAALARANDLLLFGEEIDPVSGEALGNFPQAYTHVGLINAAMSLETRTRRMRAAAPGAPTPTTRPEARL